ncbi:MAG: HDOD domain-containing protein [Phycisphaerales bacterium]|nr:MAG: HDOD domain-containing protein [Phycisphaerales bacterium]
MRVNMSKIMIVEDSAVISQPIAATLKREGYDAVIAEHGQDAITKLADGLPDVILLDLAMPVMDGLTFLKTIRANSRTKAVPVIVLSAVTEKPKIVHAVKLGIQSYLLKSRFSLQELLQQIEACIQGKASIKPAAAQPATPAPVAASPPAAQVAVEKPVGNDAAPSPAANIASSAVPTDSAAPTNPVAAQVLQDPVEALKSIKPLMTRSEVMAQIESNAELKGMSPAVTQVLKLTGNSRCSIEQVAKAISTDHGMALKILKLANSAVYTRGEPVDSIQMAVMRIGLDQIRQTVLNIAVVEQFSSNKVGGIDIGQFWEHAIATGFIASELAFSRQDKDIDSAFTMGLLHDIGRVFFADQFGEIYQQVLETAEKLQLPVEQVEARMLLYTHADVMDRILHGWKFPKQLINPVVFHHLSAGNIRRSAPREVTEVASLGLANRLAHAMMLGSSGNETIYPIHDLCELLKLDPKVLTTIRGKVRDECDKVKFALLANANMGAWTPLRQMHQEEMQTEFRPLFASSVPGFDSYGIFCEELAATPFADEEAEAEKPNIGVIHISNARERVAVTSAYRAAESQAGVSGLPLIILSPAGKLMPESSLVNGRRVQSLSTPFRIARFIDAVNRLAESADQQKAA